MTGRSQRERFAVIRKKNRRLMSITILLALIGIPPVSAIDFLTGPAGPASFRILLLGLSQALLLAVIGSLRYLHPRSYTRYATGLFVAVLLTILLPQIPDIIVTDPSRFLLFAATFLGCVFFLNLNSLRTAVMLYATVLLVSIVPFLIFKPLPLTTVIPTLVGIALIGVVRQRHQDKNIETSLELRRRKIDLHRHTLLYEQAVAATEESEARYETVIDSMAEGVIVLSSDGVMIACNRSAAEILNVHPENIVGSQVADLNLQLCRENGEPFPADELPSTFVQKQVQPVNDVVVGIDVDNSQKKWLRVNARPLFRRGSSVPYAATVTFADITEYKAQADTIRHQAFHDTLTGLANRALLKETLDLELAHASREKSILAVLFMDLDGFKNVNDSLGHSIGDALLVEVARRLRHCLRRSDTLARAGGDEFIAVLPKINSPFDARSVADKVLAELEKPYAVGSDVLSISASIGIAIFPDNGTDGDSLLRNADAAMYAVKKAGRRGIRFFGPEMNENARVRLGLLNNLRQAIQSDDLRLVFQPRLDLHTGRIDSAEALLRWNTKDGPVSPEVFIPLAEEGGLIHALGDGVLHKALSAQRQWSADNHDITVAVNLSPRQFAVPDLVERIETATHRLGVAPERLEIEITEGVMIQNVESVRRTMYALKELGLTIALDDFGTGYSSLAYLKHFPIDILKIDRAFVCEIPENTQDVAILSAIIGVARALGIRTIAEGVETQEQADFMKQVGCDAIQGYWFARPLDSQSLLDFIHRHDVRAGRPTSSHIAF